MAAQEATSSANRKYPWLANLPIRHKILLAIGLLLSLFMLNSALTLGAQHKQTETRRWADHSYQVLLQLEEMQRTALSGQVGLRGYLLTHKQSELDRVMTARVMLQNQLAQVRQMTLDNALQQARIDHVDAMVAMWNREMDRMVIAPMRELKDVDTETLAKNGLQIQTDYLAHRTVRVEDYAAALDEMSATERVLLVQRSANVDQRLNETLIANLMTAVLGLLLGLMVINLTSRLIARPIRRLTDMMTRLAAHDHDIDIRGQGRNDEIGEISRALQVFKHMAVETQQQTWLKNQTAILSSSLQQVATHREFAERLTAQLMPLIHAGVGLFYGYDEGRQRLDLLGSYGMRLVNQGATSYVPGEGLAGQCALTRAPMTLEDIPENYLRIESGSGAALPRQLTLLPVLLRDHLIGVLEFASFTPLSTLHRELLDELLPVVALTLENLNRAINTQDLLEQTREQADELRISSVTMRQQQQALGQINDTLQNKTLELEEQSQRLLASEEELRVQADELQTSNEELRQKTDTLKLQKKRLESLQRDTEQKADELARASQYKSEFLANMSHELRTPLNSLLILSRSLAENREGNLDGEQVESARIIHDSGSSLLRLINDILDLSKIEAGKMELSLLDHSLQALARSLRRNFDHVAREKNLQFSVSLDEGLPTDIHTDPTRLEQIINNLLANAFKFTTAGSVRVHIGRPGEGIAVPEALAEQSPLMISVKDSGIGIPADKAERIFNAFEQADNSTSRQYGGTGLGLSISGRLAELLGGDIVLRSEVGQGSEFILLLPERTREANPPTSATPHPAPAPRPVARAVMPAEGINDDRQQIAPGDSVILIVEDDQTFARILADMVRHKGHRVLHAIDGESGLELARRFRPLGILLDVALPGMDGWTVIERLKSDPAMRHIPVHFLSATDEANRGRELGAVGFLTKPVDREAINDAFERLLHFAEGRSRHLLVVDDDADARSAVRTLLRHDDVVIDEAASAEEALQHIAQTGYDCIVLDLGLPGMSGMDMLEKLAGSGTIPPVVVYSGRELSREENLRIRQYTDSIVIKGARSPERLLDEVSLFLHSIRQAASSERPPAPANTDDLHGHRVLLVDDDMRNLFALSKVLRGWGLQVSMAQEGQKALQMLAEDTELELVLMDIMMPGMDGYQAMRAIRAQPQWAKLPIIALTAKAMRGDREQCLEAGANDYLSKPIDVDKLASMIRVWLRR